MSVCRLMADSATPRTADQPSRCVAVAYSGGLDSTALLHATALQAARLNQQGAGLQVLALHVHHGLSTHADAWVLHCQRQCADWAAAGLPLKLQYRSVIERPAAGQSIEAWARNVRYAALREMAQAAGADLLLLAQHQRDQAETLLLQALRGAGVAGLAGMPARQWREGLCWARPWLNQPRAAVEAYVRQHRLSHIDDDSNADPRYARNRLRLSIWPALLEAFPQAQASLAHAATWAQQALALQQEMARIDLQSLADVQGFDLAAMQTLSPARASNALRAWLKQQTGGPAPASLVQRLQDEWQSAGTGSWPCRQGVLRLYRGRLNWVQDLPLSAPKPAPRSLDLSIPGHYRQVDWQGSWQVEQVETGGVSALQLQIVSQRSRQGGEQFQRRPGGTARSLKKACQEAGIPSWERDGPLLFAGTRLLFVPGLGLDARCLAAQGEAQLAIRWCSDAETAS